MLNEIQSRKMLEVDACDSMTCPFYRSHDALRGHVERLGREWDMYDHGAWGYAQELFNAMDALEKEFPTKEIR